MPRTNGSYPMEELKRKVMAKATRSPKTARELAERVGIDGYDGRALGRPIAELVREGKLVKNPLRVPTYAKAA